MPKGVLKFLHQVLVIGRYGLSQSLFKAFHPSIRPFFPISFTLANIACKALAAYSLAFAHTFRNARKLPPSFQVRALG